MKNKRIGLAMLGALCCAAWMAAQQSAPLQAAHGPGAQGRGRAPRGEQAARQRTGRKVLIAWADTRNGLAQHDSVSHALAVIERLGYETGLYDTYIRTDSNIISKHPKMTTGEPASGGPDLNMADAIFFLGHREIELTPEQKADLLAFVHDDGKGFVAAHTATTAFLSWPEFGEMLGGRYDGHPWGSFTGTVINEDPAFPATRHFPPTFEIHDEFYQSSGFSRSNSRVLLRLDISKLPANPNVHVSNGDFPIAWAKMYGKGRVFYATFAHDARTWDDPDIYQMYFEAIKWALKLTDGDATPRPFPGAAPVASK
jgi:type 1 glutamine amidotransferase